MDWYKRLIGSLKWKKEMYQKPLLVVDAAKYRAVCEALDAPVTCGRCHERASRVFVVGNSFMLMTTSSCLKHLDPSAWT